MFGSRVSMRTWVTPNGLPNHTPSVCLGGYLESLVAQWPVSLARHVRAQVAPKASLVAVEAYENIITRYLPYTNRLK